MSVIVALPVISPTTDFYGRSAVWSAGRLRPDGGRGWPAALARDALTESGRRDTEAAQARMVVANVVHVNKAGGGPGRALIEVA
jgi:hypothetical protein